ncbi:MAG: sigma-70 family RNA polymerase sigma factor [Balneolaceae bacterium]|nr:MAG: sigma-70 family RNA polymerase sigma factor [Balneolaceae bacterium]
MSHHHDITGLLQEINHGSQEAYNKLFPLVYEELRKLAGSQISYNPYAGTGQTMSKTDLVHEAYLKLTASPPDIEWKNRAHFYRIAARCIRSILIDYVRMKTAEKRGGKRQAITYIDQFVTEREEETLLEVDHALKKLDKLNDRFVRIVELRYFLGLNINETARILEISASTVKRDWAKARGWLYKELKSA